MTLFHFNSDFTNQESRSLKTSCILDTSNDPGENRTHKPKPARYDIQIEGFFENPNPQGRCGGWRSYSVTLKKDGKTIVDNVPYNVHCGEDGILDDLFVNPHEGYIWAGERSSKKTLWYDKDLPITYDGLYNPSASNK